MTKTIEIVVKGGEIGRGNDVVLHHLVKEALTHRATKHEAHCPYAACLRGEGEFMRCNCSVQIAIENIGTFQLRNGALHYEPQP